MPDHTDMPEADPRQIAMDGLLRRSLGAPVPAMSRDFHSRLEGAVRRTSAPPHPLARTLLGAYAVVAALVSVLVMQGQGLGGSVIAGTMIAAFVVLGGARLATRRPAPVTPR